MPKRTEPAPASPRLSVVADGAASDLPDLTRSFERHLRLKNLAPRTIVSYLQAARLMTEWMVARYGPVEAADLTAEHLGEYFRHLQEGPKLLVRTTRAGATMVPSGDAKRSAATVAGHYRTLQQFFKYLVEEGDIAASPLAALPCPKVPGKPVPVVKDHELEALFKSLGGRTSNPGGTTRSSVSSSTAASASTSSAASPSRASTSPPTRSSCGAKAAGPGSREAKRRLGLGNRF